jgi:hypothetical protein
VVTESIRKIPCVGGPLDRRVFDVSSVETLPLLIVLPHWEVEEATEAEPVRYRPMKLVMFGRVVRVLMWDGVHPSSYNVECARSLLRAEALEAWMDSPAVPEVPDGH